MPYRQIVTVQQVLHIGEHKRIVHLHNQSGARLEIEIPTKDAQFFAEHDRFFIDVTADLASKQAPEPLPLAPNIAPMLVEAATPRKKAKRRTAKGKTHRTSTGTKLFPLKVARAKARKPARKK